ncbi:MAG: hypothetical protein EVJ48_02885 [Candidatus Acidulodesulfobacterium acidiphilum]|uniref:Uncharacterized protein n=1 Tax=Candidatus Acidulodesulfobacterium acidiphilum TaxID=2597224 RepID=A0A520XFC3_9DELT|nr:MAG: hypothetical protein EVJ48_02885 [Candidatus Acidulodesulfobacterium acidiphilum]
MKEEINYEEINYIREKYKGFYLYFDLMDCVEKVNYLLLPEDELSFLYECRKRYENEWYKFF